MAEAAGGTGSGGEVGDSFEFLWAQAGLDYQLGDAVVDVYGLDRIGIVIQGDEDFSTVIGIHDADAVCKAQASLRR